MKKNNKGFFLAETIVVIALVTTVMAFVYPNVSKLYDNYKNRALYYDQSEDIYILRAVSKAEESKITTKKTRVGTDGLEEVTDFTDIYGKEADEYELEKLYVAKYLGNPTSSSYNLNKYLKRVKKVKDDRNAYRLIGVFKLGDKTRYASIKIN